MKKKIIINYLISKYDDKNCLKKFIYNYKKFKPGTSHRLVITFKNIKKNDNLLKSSYLKKVNFHKNFDYKEFNDYDWGSYRRLAQKYINHPILFMNCHSIPIKQNWLKILEKNYSKESIIGPFGSYESMTTSALQGRHSNNFIMSIIFAIKNFFYFKIFPNPHLRSNCFMILGKDFLKFNLNKKFKFKKYGTWINESGRSGMTNYFKEKGFKIFVVNSDGKKFKENEWKLSQTFCTKKQNKALISDKFSRIYSSASYIQKVKLEKITWG